MTAQGALNNGNKHYKNAKWDDAIANFSLAIDLEKTTITTIQADAYLERAKARLFQNSKEHDEGYYIDVINDASIAIAADVGNKDDARIIRACGYYLSGDYESAKTDCDEIVKSNPEKVQVQELLGGIYYKKKEYSSAKKRYMKAISTGIPGLSLLEKYLEACKQQKMADK